MQSPAFLLVDHVMAVHRRMISEFGGDPLLHDPGLLESAVVLPASKFDGKFLHGGIAAMAAAYLFHICNNHPFVDGNKRTALTSAEIFLLLNDHSLRATDDELEVLTMGVAAGSISKSEVVTFFQHHAHSRSEP